MYSAAPLAASAAESYESAACFWPALAFACTVLEASLADPVTVSFTCNETLLSEQSGLLPTRLHVENNNGAACLGLRWTYKVGWHAVGVDNEGLSLHPVASDSSYEAHLQAASLAASLNVAVPSKTSCEQSTSTCCAYLTTWCSNVKLRSLV